MEKKVFTFRALGKGEVEYSLVSRPFDDITNEKISREKRRIIKSGMTRIEGTYYSLLIYARGRAHDRPLCHLILDLKSFKRLLKDQTDSYDVKKEYYVIREEKGWPVDFRKNDKFLAVFFPDLLG